MKRYWNARWRHGDLESRLRNERPTPPQHLVDELVRMAADARRRPARAWSRLSFAAAFTTIVLGGFASVGGLAYASTTVVSAADTVKQVVAKTSLVRETTPADDQYEDDDEEEVEEEAEVVGDVAGEVAGGAQPPTPPQDDVLGGAVGQETLPFTGLALVPVALLSLAFIGLGIVLRRRE